MLIKGHQIKALLITLLLNLFLLLIFSNASSVNHVQSKKLAETNPVPATNSTEEKCGSCGGGTIYPSPPPPALPPPSPPPPSPKKQPPSQYCPPPPSPSSFIYITGPPGNLYPVDESFSGATSGRRHRSFAFVLLPLLGALFSTLAFW